MLYIDINGINIHYIIKKSEKKDCETVLILHGWGCNGELYGVVTEHLVKNFNVIIPDLPGFGKSEEPAEAYGVGDYAEFIIEFCKKTGLKKFILFGHSLGGRIALKLLGDTAVNNPFEISRVIITGGAGIIPKRGFKSKVKSKIYKAGRLTLETSLIKKFFPNAAENLRRKNGSPDYVAASPKMRQCLVKIVNEDLTSLLPNVKSSVLLIWGENDDQTPLNDGRLMERMMPDAGLAVINGAGHYAFLDRPKLFNDVIDAFLLTHD